MPNTSPRTADRSRRRPDADTLAYYEANASAYVAQTRDVPMGAQQDRFLSRLAPGARILDTGCGSGRDTAAFRARGFVVDAIDGSPALAAEAAAYLGTPVAVVRHQDVDVANEYDGIWASATLLHVPRTELEDVFHRYARALRAGGTMFCSFKLGQEDGSDAAERWFTRLTVKSAAQILAAVPDLVLEHTDLTPDDTRPDTTWLSLMLRRAPNAAG
jgi:SAM-dependent methyltransferase